MFICQTRNLLKKALSSQLRNKSYNLHRLYNVSSRSESKHGAFTVHPAGFWADKILERESKRPVIASSEPRLLIEKTVNVFYMEDYLPFKSDPVLLDEYIFSNGKIRTGKLLEDLDALAGAIAYKHIDNGDPKAAPLTVVTASVDRFDLFLPEAGIVNYKLSGHVTYVGSSSMEVFIKAETCGDDLPESNENPDTLCVLGKNTVLATRFTMVAIDSATQKPVKVNPLRLTSKGEERLFEMAEATKLRKKREKEASLTRQPPTPAERLEIHDVFLEYSRYTSDTSDERQPLPKDKVWMSDTKIESNFLMQPQDRNIHNNIFGGYLMRRAYELAYANTALFMKSSSPVLLSMDEVAFRKPVHVGTLLNLKSNIVLSEGFPHRTVQVRVVAEVVDIEKDTREVTNVFHFTLVTGSPEVRLRRILPKTYAESMLWIDAKRRRQQGIHSRHVLLESIKEN
ncbi:hypothetical protein G6F43_001344 [Rhizopus delemar]|nr:hypothetical protein G6F43_001344 [Rhizopus delemar]